MAALTESDIRELADYIGRRSAVLDRDLLPYGEPAGKHVLVFGSGYGTEVLWAIERGAASVVALDLKPVSPEPLQLALRERGLQFDRYEFRRENIHDTATSGERFDLIVSNGVFEHVLDLKGVLGAFRYLLKPAGRVAIFADGLWSSSLGGHMHRATWEHLWCDPAALRAELPPDRWRVYCDELNRMTAVDFLEAIRSVGMIVLQLRLGRDPSLLELPDALPKIRERQQVSPTDLSIVSIGCELCFVENL
jgi:SAM-dependent methyltransferase